MILTPEWKQHLAYQLLWDQTTNYIGFGGGAGGGKSFLLWEWLTNNTVRWPESRWFIGREELSKIYKYGLPTFYKVLKKHNISKEDYQLNQRFNYLQNRHTGAMIDFR